MRLSFLVVALFFFAPVLPAQHRSESTSSDTHSSSSSSSSSSTSSSSSSSPSYSGGSSSSSSSHSSSASSSDSSSHSTTHSSGSSSSDTYRGSTAHGSNEGASSHAGSSPSRHDNDRNIRDNDTRRTTGGSNITSTSTTSPSSTTRPVRDSRTVRDSKNDRAVTTDRQTRPDAKPEKEKRNIFLFWRHPKKDPESDLKSKTQPPKRCKQGENCQTEPDLRVKVQPPKRCKVGEVCLPPPCPEGSYRGEHGCVTPSPIFQACRADEEWSPTTHTCVARPTHCPTGEYWNGSVCLGNDVVDPCGDLASQLVRQEKLLRSAAIAQETACASVHANQKCAETQMNYRQETDRYVMLKEQYDQCRARSGRYPGRAVPNPTIP